MTLLFPSPVFLLFSICNRSLMRDFGSPSNPVVAVLPRPDATLFVCCDVLQTSFPPIRKRNVAVVLLHKKVICISSRLPIHRPGLIVSPCSLSPRLNLSTSSFGFFVVVLSLRECPFAATWVTYNFHRVARSWVQDWVGPACPCLPVCDTKIFR